MTDLDILALKSIKGISNKTVLSILNRFGSHWQNYHDLWDILQEFYHLSREEINTAYQKAKESLEEHRKQGITIVSYVDVQFPQQLREIENPPLLLYIKGDVTILRPENSVAVIGMRQPTESGKKIGFEIGKNLAESGLIVVSGLALGCDTAGHKGCIAGGGKTIAVLAHGLQTIYPPSNQELAQTIVETGGCLVSEYPLGYHYYGNTFIERDRLQSGLSTAVIVIETDLTGGTMHTVKFSLEQKRILACIVYPLQKQPRGNQLLITSGKAIPLANQEELLSLIEVVKVLG
ncbi:DNA-processing protein DprA [Gloeocapsa sp. PCC 73106]|uniref:DNA-processing protein DprA n=1 Tax=Gloeocapsa sp. PCC 73106 TaxID=102232 RepID=UPI0002AC33EE|nr:DNA-processing protein DprA [Gloeocapsa sp. PCC 73106]ELR97840.1 putative Rossmann fold nucleotide-binding protein involved in DNA uptake [Gloeocapsa sp. PCC 73106]